MLTYENYMRDRLATKRADVARLDDLSNRIGASRYEKNYRSYCLKTKAAKERLDRETALLTEAFVAVLTLKRVTEDEARNIEEDLSRAGFTVEA